MKKSNELTLKQAIDELMNQTNMSDHIYAVRISEVWGRIMGKTIADHTLEMKLKKDILFIRLDSSVLREELSYAKQKIIQVINRELQKNIIKNITFQ